MRTRIICALPIGLAIAAVAEVAVPRASADVRVLITPLGWLASPVLARFRAPQPLPNSAALTRERGWCNLTLDLDDHGSGLFLELSGRCCLASAAIEYADGARDSLDLHQARRGSGLYLLHAFDQDRGVRRVTLALEALSDRAYVGARLMR